MYKGQNVELNFGATASSRVGAEAAGSARASRLDMRFADEEDAGDIECVLQIADACEYDEESEYYFRMPNNTVPGSESSLNVRASRATIEQDCNKANTRWIVMETPLPEEQVVGAARLFFSTPDAMIPGQPKKATVDILACVPDTQFHSVRAQLLAQLERIALGQGMNTLVIHTLQHRTDTQNWLEECGYEELGGFACEEAGILKPTMVFEFHKNLHTARANVVNSASASTSTSTSDTDMNASQSKGPIRSHIVAEPTSAPAAVTLSASTAQDASVPTTVFEDLDLNSLTSEDFEIVDSSKSSSSSSADATTYFNTDTGTTSTTTGAGTGIHGLLNDLFAALHREHD